MPTMNDSSRAPDQLAAVAELVHFLERHRIDYWLFGGWAVDFHLGRITREHGDIDLAIWGSDLQRTGEMLGDRGWEHSPEAGEDGYTCYERGAVRLEIAFLARDEGGCIYTPLREGRGEWPADSFGAEVAELRGVRVRVVGRASLIADKSAVRADPQTAEKDRADVASLIHS